MVAQSGTISTQDEVDFLPVDLVGGVKYSIAVFGADSGFSLPDPAFGVFDSANTLVFPIADNTTDANGNLSRDPQAEFTPLNSGTYMVAVFDVTFPIPQTGNYVLTWNEGPVDVPDVSDFFFA